MWFAAAVITVVCFIPNLFQEFRLDAGVCGKKRVCRQEICEINNLQVLIWNMLIPIVNELFFSVKIIIKAVIN
ncbi:MAG: hypothetical protein R3297_05960 [Desulfobulbales bacterium]|nr:hypothetical protein [Desulfobulbales bacterium]